MLRFHLTAVGITVNKKMNNKCWQGSEKKEPWYIVDGNVTSAATIEISMAITQSTENRTILWSFYATPWNLYLGIWVSMQ
jgi:hypothetical protein